MGHIPCMHVSTSTAVVCRVKAVVIRDESRCTNCPVVKFTGETWETYFYTFRAAKVKLSGSCNVHSWAAVKGEENPIQSTTKIQTTETKLGPWFTYFSVQICPECFGIGPVDPAGQQLWQGCFDSNMTHHHPLKGLFFVTLAEIVNNAMGRIPSGKKTNLFFVSRFPRRPTLKSWWEVRAQTETKIQQWFAWPCGAKGIKLSKAHSSSSGYF